MDKKKCQNGLEVLENIFHPINDYSKVHKRKCLIRLFSPKSQSGTRDFKVCNVYVNLTTAEFVL